MDSLDRLSHNIEAAAALIQSLRRENRDLAKSAASAAATAHAQALKQAEIQQEALDQAKIEIERLRQEPAVDAEAQERARQAELEAARMAQSLETERQEWDAVKRGLEARIHELELQLLAAAREETMPLPPPPDRSQELENLARRCAELEVMLAEAQEAFEKAKGSITAMQVRIAESADPEEVSVWQQKIHALSSELEGLRGLQGMKEKLESDRNEVRRQKRALTAIAVEREMTRKKLEEIYSMLDNLRLS